MTNTQKLNQAAKKLAKGGHTQRQKTKLVHEWAALAKELLKGNR